MRKRTLGLDQCGNKADREESRDMIVSSMGVDAVFESHGQNIRYMTEFKPWPGMTASWLG